jgi:hypothetical protein
MTALGIDDTSRYLRVIFFGCLGSWLLWGGLFVLAVTVESNALLEVVLGESAFLLLVLTPAVTFVGYVVHSTLSEDDGVGCIGFGLVLFVVFGVSVAAPQIPFTMIVILGSACGLYALWRLFGMYGISYATRAVFTGVALTTVTPLIVYLLATSLLFLVNREALALDSWSGRVVWTLILVVIIANSFRYRGHLRTIWTGGRDQNQESSNTSAALADVQPTVRETVPVVHAESVISVLVIVCPWCSGRLALDECFVGHQIVCPKCGTPFMVDST